MIDIDYYVYFSKAYFAFNAYLKYKYPDKNDADKIRSIKNESSIQRKFRHLLDEGKHFIDDINSLNISLDRAQIQNQGEYILFNKVKVYDHRACILFNDTYRRIAYDIRAINGEKFTFNVDGQSSTSFKFEELESILEQTQISNPQKSKVREVITVYVESYSINLLPEIEKLQRFHEFGVDEQKKIETKLYRGFIEIAYALRNALFHSEVEPNSEVMRAYKFAYFILRKLIKEIPTT